VPIVANSPGPTVVLIFLGMALLTFAQPVFWWRERKKFRIALSGWITLKLGASVSLGFGLVNPAVFFLMPWLFSGILLYAKFKGFPLATSSIVIRGAAAGLLATALIMGLLTLLAWGIHVATGLD